MKINRFEDLLVWQKSRSLAVAVYQITGTGRFSRDFGLRDQVRRAAVSVMSNIAEGFGRYSRPEVRRFVTIARGSLAEVQSQLYLARDLEYLTDADHLSLNTRCIEVDRMLAALRTSLERTHAPPKRSAPRT
ncbi:MAG TPA: four helix bundle protein [Longimicrobium sp.]|jgi:four helix bundle protein